MKIDIAGFTASRYRENLVLNCCDRRLLSYYFIKEDMLTDNRKGSCQYYSLQIIRKLNDMKIKRRTKPKIKKRKRIAPELFIDSGAFSAWTQKVAIDLKEYIAFIKKYEKYIAYYAVLDDIENPNITLQNQIRMEAAGLKPVPCFHYGEPEAYLRGYLDRGIVALGGMVPISTAKLRPWLDHLFTKYLCHKNGMPKIKVHGFGMTSIPLMTRYPWYSVDSTSWVATSRFGGILVPKVRSIGGYDYLKPLKIDISNRRKKSGMKDGQHFDSLTTMERKQILRYVDKMGYPMGRSKFKLVKLFKYELRDNERWAVKDREKGTGIVEIIKEYGLINDYHFRDKLNIEYFVKLEKALPKWPWAFKLKKKKGFDFR